MQLGWREDFKRPQKYVGYNYAEEDGLGACLWRCDNGFCKCIIGAKLYFSL